MELYRQAFRAMGSPCELQVYARAVEHARQVAQQVIADVARIEQRYSRYRADSLTSAINRAAAAGGSLEVDAETAALVDYADTCHRESGGLFDITTGALRRAWRFNGDTLPSQAAIDAALERVGWHKVSWNRPRLTFTRPGMEVDFGGIGKEYAVDRAAGICLAAGIRNGLVNLGGDLRIMGPHPDGEPWWIGIRDPARLDGSIGGILLNGGALATSGDYARCLKIGGQRYGHILSTKTGWPVDGLAAVSVLADACLVAGSACTIAMLKGREGPEWLTALGLPHLWIDRAGQRAGSGAFAGLASGSAPPAVHTGDR